MYLDPLERELVKVDPGSIFQIDEFSLFLKIDFFKKIITQIKIIGSQKLKMKQRAEI